MNQDMIKEQWKSLTPNIKQHWGKLTDDDLKVSDGSINYLTDKVEKRYGISHSEAEKQVREFETQIGSHTSSNRHH
ncbi:CsbD family protein [Dyella sp. M7H15-1]|uniref:CsbD family protein n=1 Tax=Dyella sp. M7H15-1 TaxID=2501295 RepID=UPI001005075E|nr:CsbD family protein [Dyella sp. M7H15-1]QAU24797.1 CsbD family protein [Dyella sp. M7H15-1]